MLKLFRKNNPHFFLNRSEKKNLSEQVRRFEQSTGCEIIFHLRRRLGKDPIDFNRRLFHRHGLHENETQRGVLVTLALAQRKFAVWVDAGIEQHVGEELRAQICQSLTQDLKQGHHLEVFLNVLTGAEKILKPLGFHSEGPTQNHKALIEDEK